MFEQQREACPYRDAPNDMFTNIKFGEFWEQYQDFRKFVQQVVRTKGTDSISERVGANVLDDKGREFTVSIRRVNIDSKEEIGSGDTSWKTTYSLKNFKGGRVQCRGWCE